MSKIKEWVKGFDFWKNDTGRTVEALHKFMVSKGISNAESREWIESLICAMKDEYGE